MTAAKKAAAKTGTARGKGGHTFVFQAGAQPGAPTDADAELEAGGEKTLVEEMFATLSGIDGGIVLIHRAPEQTDRDLSDIYVGKVPFSAFGGSVDGLLDLLRDSYGGGKFHLRFGNVKGHWKGKQFTVRVEKVAAAAPVQAAAPTAPAVAPAPKLTDNPHFGKALELGVTGVFALLTAMATRGGGGSGVTVADLVALQQANKQPDVFESLGKLAQVRELLMPEGGPSAPAAPGGAAGWMELAKSAMQALPHLLAAQAGGAAPALAAPQPHTPESGPAEPESAPAPEQPSAQASAGPAVDPQAEQRVLIGMLINGAKNQSPAAAYAVMVDDTMGPAVVDQLLSQPDPAVVVMGMFPPLAPYEAWVRELVEALRQLAAPEHQMPAAAGQAGGS